MAKNVLKEIIIILLLTLAIILILGVLLYDYVPMNKVVPETITYTASEETKKALEEKAEIEQDEVVLTYEVTSTDLKNYKQTSDYKAGRKNPFSDVTSNTGTTTTGSNATSTNSSGSTSVGNNEDEEDKNENNTNVTNDKNTDTSLSNDNTSTNYYPDKGIK